MKGLFSTAFMALAASCAAAPAASSSKPVSATSTTASSGAPTYTPLTPAQIKSLQTQLILAPSIKDKEQILFPPGSGSANNVTFQFVNSPGTAPQDGSVIVGSLDAIPGLIGTNLGAAVGFIGPCGYVFFSFVSLFFFFPFFSFPIVFLLDAN